MQNIRLLLVLFLTIFTTNVFSQVNEKETKQIEVTGSAELEITPDIIYYSFELKEYKNGKTEFKLIELENKLFDILKKLNIDKANLFLENTIGQQYYVKRKTSEFIASKKYVLKLSDIAKIDTLTGQLEYIGVDKISISDVSHSKISDYRKELKIKAIKAAKEKADYLLSAIDEKIGELIYVQEINNSYLGVGTGMWSNVSNTNSFNWTVVGETGDLTVKKIKLRYEILTRFKIK